jgi:hypothetical protein
VVDPSVVESDVDRGGGGSGGGGMLLVFTAVFILAESLLLDGLQTGTFRRPVSGGEREGFTLAAGEDDEDVCEESMASGKVWRLDKVLDPSFVDGDGKMGASNKGTEKA